MGDDKCLVTLVHTDEARRGSGNAGGGNTRPPAGKRGEGERRAPGCVIVSKYVVGPFSGGLLGVLARHTKRAARLNELSEWVVVRQGSN